MKRMLFAASAALALAAVPIQATAQDRVVIVEVTPVANELASHLKVRLDTIPTVINLPDKQAAVVCDRTLKQMRDGGGRCVAIGMSQGLIEAVRQAMREG